MAAVAIDIIGPGSPAALFADEMGRESSPSSAPWHVLWTHSHCEQLVHDQLAAKGFHPFLPFMAAWSTRAGHRRPIRVPMFPGYVFLHDPLDKAAHVEARKVRGAVRILGEGWDRPTPVPEAEIDAIRQLIDSRLPTLPHPYLCEGRRIKIVAGPLAGLEGILVRARPEKGLLVLSLNLLQRSVAAEVDWTHVASA